MNEKIFVEINGLKQGMFLQSENIENPVLLFLHGGPGSPEVAFTQQYPTGLEKIFTVCWWEQRGSGISYHRNIPKEAMTIDQMKQIIKKWYASLKNSPLTRVEK